MVEVLVDIDNNDPLRHASAGFPYLLTRRNSVSTKELNSVSN